MRFATEDESGRPGTRYDVAGVGLLKGGGYTATPDEVLTAALGPSGIVS